MKRALALAFDETYYDENIVRRPRWIRKREEHFDTLDVKDFVGDAGYACNKYLHDDSIRTVQYTDAENLFM